MKFKINFVRQKAFEKL